MELANWGQKLLEAMTEVLDGERGVLTREAPIQKQAPFEIRSDIEVLLTEFKNSKLRDKNKIHAIFQKLAPYFEGGFLLERQANVITLGTRKTSWYLSEIFLFGKKFKPTGGKPTLVPFAVPPLRLFQVLRGRGPALLKSFELQGIESLNDSAVFLMRVSDDIVFAMLCNRPEPWRILHIENFFETVLALLFPEIAKS